MAGIDERQLVELVTREVIKKLLAEGYDFNSAAQVNAPLPLILLDGSHTDFEELLTLLQSQLKSGDGKFRLFLGNNLTQDALPTELHSRVVEAGTEDEMREILDQTNIICLPWITLAGLSRLIHLQPECSVSQILTQALFEGTPVRMRKHLAKPQVDLYQSYEPTPMTRRVQGLVQEGKLMGIEWLTKVDLTALLADLPHEEQIGANGVLSAKDVKKLKFKGQKEVRVPDGTVVTDLAQDELKKYGIQLILD